jgi:hypothetical protein
MMSGSNTSTSVKVDAKIPLPPGSIGFEGQQDVQVSFENSIDISKETQESLSKEDSDETEISFQIPANTYIDLELSWSRAEVPATLNVKTLIDGTAYVKLLGRGGPIRSRSEGVWKIADVLAEDARLIDTPATLSTYVVGKLSQKQIPHECPPGPADDQLLADQAWPRVTHLVRFEYSPNASTSSDLMNELQGRRKEDRVPNTNDKQRLPRDSVLEMIKKNTVMSDDNGLSSRSNGVAVDRPPRPREWCYTGPCNDPRDGERPECIIECDEGEGGYCIDGTDTCSDCQDIKDRSCDPDEEE